MIEDMAALFAREGEGARQIAEELKDQAKDALELALGEAPEGTARQRYLYAKERAFPLLLLLGDPAEQGAALTDVAKTLKLNGRDLRKALSELEKETQGEAVDEEDEAQDLIPEPGTERHERAMEILECPDILKKAAEDMKRLGHVGELNTKKLAFVCSVSARAGAPIQPSTYAQSSAGKNHLWDVVLSLLPPEKVIK